MKDGANQEIKVGTFCIYTGQNTATMSLGFIVGVTGTGVQMKERWSSKPTRKTSLRVIQVPDEVAKSFDSHFLEEMRKEFPI